MSEIFLKKGLYIDNISDVILTITNIKVSSDLRHAKIFLTSLDRTVDIDKVIQHLNKNVGFYKKNIGKEIRLRNIPDLRFFHDSIYNPDMPLID